MDTKDGPIAGTPVERAGANATTFVERVDTYGSDERTVYMPEPVAAPAKDADTAAELGTDRRAGTFADPALDGDVDEAGRER